jgi:hypothetical protein
MTSRDIEDQPGAVRTKPKVHRGLEIGMDRHEWYKFHAISLRKLLFQQTNAGDERWATTFPPWCNARHYTRFNTTEHEEERMMAC